MLPRLGATTCPALPSSPPLVYEALTLMPFGMTIQPSQGDKNSRSRFQSTPQRDTQRQPSEPRVPIRLEPVGAVMMGWKHR